MTQDEIDTMWQKAMHQSIKEGEMFTRYQFVNLVTAKEREECAKILEVTDLSGLKDNPSMQKWVAEMLLAYANAIRARGEQA